MGRGEGVVGNDGRRSGEGLYESGFTRIWRAGKNDGRFALMFDVEWVVLTGGGAHGIVPLESAYLSTKAVA
jgi:hypothetical protein